MSHEKRKMHLFIWLDWEVERELLEYRIKFQAKAEVLLNQQTFKVI